MAATADLPDFGPLRDAPGIELIEPGAPGWDAARMGFLTNVPCEPVAVAVPATVEAVADVVRFAARSGLRVAPQRTGHGAAARQPLDGTILLLTKALDEVVIDQGARTARVGAGALWRDVCGQASEHGLWPLAGSSPSVGIAGYTLGGGMSFIARSRGLACNSVTAIELVLPDGTFVRTDAGHQPELFWALRGGAAPGVVTALEFKLYGIGHLTAGHLFFPAERGAEVLRRWQRLLPNYPRELTTMGRLLQFPPLPEIPEPLRGQAMALIEVIFLGPPDELKRYLAPLRALGPTLDTVAPAPPIALAELHMDPPEPVPATVGAHQLLEALPDELLATFAGACQAGSPLVMIELRHLGGAIAEPPAGAGALAALPGQFCSVGVGVTATPEQAAEVQAALDELEAELEPHAVGVFRNFTDRPGNSFHDEETAARLRAVVRQWDPDGVLVPNHPVPVAG